MIYYGIILIAVVLFGSGFALQDQYRKRRGSGLKISMESATIGAFAGLIVLLAFNKFSLHFTWFSILMAVWSALNGIAFTFCTFKALDYINLSLFSVFAMLGGMVLPFFQGIFFYSEVFSLAKIVCVVFIVASLLCTVEKGEKKRGIFFYIGIFVLNGMSGVISKLFTASKFPKTSALEYSTWIAIATIIFAGLIWIILSVSAQQKNQKESLNVTLTSKKTLAISYLLGATCGAINRVANLLLVFALMFVDSSVQYPMVTGGTIIISTIISFFGDKKPSKKEIISVVLAFVGTCALFFIPV